MTQDEAISIINRVDIDKYPSLMDISIEAEKQNKGILYTAYFSVKSNCYPYNYIRLHLSKFTEVEELYELDLIRKIRNIIAVILLHELDECLQFDGKIVSAPHLFCENGDSLTIPSCLCSTYMCQHKFQAI